MGHANLSNMCEFFLKQIYEKGRTSLAQCIQEMVLAGEALHASEGDYEEEEMLGFGLEQVLRYLLEYWENAGKRGRKASPVVEPVVLTDGQAKVYSEWFLDGFDWDQGEEVKVLDGIEWKFCEGWSNRWHDVELLGNVTN